MGSQTETRRIVDYDIDDVGAIHPQYWQGVSAIFTKWSDAYPAMGENAHDALEDALCLAAIDGWAVDTITDDLPKTPTVCDLCKEQMAEFGDDDDEPACESCEMVYCVVLWLA